MNERMLTLYDVTPKASERLQMDAMAMQLQDAQRQRDFQNEVARMYSEGIPEEVAAAPKSPGMYETDSATQLGAPARRQPNMQDLSMLAMQRGMVNEGMKLQQQHAQAEKEQIASLVTLAAINPEAATKAWNSGALGQKWGQISSIGEKGGYEVIKNDSTGDVVLIKKGLRDPREPGGVVQLPGLLGAKKEPVNEWTIRQAAANGDPVAQKILDDKTLQEQEKKNSKALPATQLESLADMKQVASTMKEAQELLRTKKVDTGPLSGRAQSAAAMVGLANDDFVNLSQKFQTVQNIMLKLRSGAAVTESEYARFLKEFPTPNDAPATRDRKLANAMGYFNTLMDQKMNVYEEGGYKVPRNTVGGAPGNQQPKRTTSGTLPPEASSRIREGVETVFANGQVWTKRNGQYVRVR